MADFKTTIITINTSLKPKKFTKEVQTAQVSTAILSLLLLALTKIKAFLASWTSKLLAVAYTSSSLTLPND
jgi:hypothetical protein